MARKNILETDVLIIGGGITGAAIARELSRYQVEASLIEKSGELCAGQSKKTQGNIYTGVNMANSLILKSLVLQPGTPLTALYDPGRPVLKWCEEGFEEWPQVFKDLDIKWRYLPYLMVATGKDQIEDLNKIRDLSTAIGNAYGKEIYHDFKEVDKNEIHDLEPNVSKNVDKGLYATRIMMDVFNPELVIALAENAKRNGVRIVLDAEVTGISQRDGYQIVQTAKGPIETRFIINAAGGNGERIADMGGSRDWGLEFFKTQFVILDKRLKGLIKGMVRRPNVPGKMRTIQVRDEGNIMVQCGTYTLTYNPEDSGFDRAEIVKTIELAKQLVPAISVKDIIACYGGVRPLNTRNVTEHIVEFPPDNPRFINAMIRMPGFAGALPMARHVVTMLADAGLELVSKPDFISNRKAIPRFRELSNDDRAKLIAQDSKYGRVVCRCESVSEGEIVEAVKRGAATLDGVKFRTRVSMGKCQGNFCSARVAAILARELNIPPNTITKKGYKSNYAI